MSEDERRYNAEMTVLLEAARKRHCAFYKQANNDDILAFDSLLLARVMLTAGTEVSGKFLSADERRAFERDNIAVEQLFTELREKVRSSEAFGKVPDATRHVIEQEVFQVQSRDDGV